MIFFIKFTLYILVENEFALFRKQWDLYIRGKYGRWFVLNGKCVYHSRILFVSSFRHCFWQYATNLCVHASDTRLCAPCCSITAVSFWNVSSMFFDACCTSLVPFSRSYGFYGISLKCGHSFNQCIKPYVYYKCVFTFLRGKDDKNTMLTPATKFYVIVISWDCIKTSY